MGGIAGIFNFDGRPVEQEAIHRMTAAMRHRGPDGRSHRQDGSAALGACAMHTVPGSREAGQPWCNEASDLVVVLDGYFTNHAALREDLLRRGARLRNSSDCELLLRAFETWREECVSHLDGEFAFIVWDMRKGSIYCARDHHGLRPLFYHLDRDRLIMASEFSALHAVLPNALAPDEDVLVQLMANQCHFSDETVWQGVKRVMPAHCQTFSAGKNHARRYWDLPEPYTIRYSSDAEYAEHYRHVLTECVRKASRSDGKLAFEVSGGLDSSAVFAVADRLDRDGALSAQEIAAYALAGPPGSAADEVFFIQAVSDHLDRPIRQLPLHMPQLGRFLQEAGQNADIPYYPNSVMAAGMYRAMHEDGCRVAMNGLGGDEWLNGRVTLFHEALAHRDWQLLQRSLADAASSLGARTTSRAFWQFGLRPLLASPVKSIAGGFAKRLFTRKPSETPWLSADARTRLAELRESHQASIAARDDTHGRSRLLNQPMTGMILEHASRMRSQCGVEGRHPLLAREFIEFAAATPEATKLRGSQQKFTHRNAISGILPDTVVSRQTKAEFAIVIEEKCQAIENFVENVQSDALDRLLDREGLKRLFTLSRQRRLDQPWKWQLWAVFASAAFLSESDWKANGTL